jgi:uncharacterized protein
MSTRIFYAVLLLVAMAVPGLATAASDDVTRVVYHVNSGESGVHLGALRNVQNHINAVGAENLDIKVVMHGGGLNLLTGANENPDLQSAVDSLKLQGVDFQVCRNTMTSRQIRWTRFTTRRSPTSSRAASSSWPSCSSRAAPTQSPDRFLPRPSREGALLSI